MKQIFIILVIISCIGIAVFFSQQNKNASSQPELQSVGSEEIVRLENVSEETQTFDVAEKNDRIEEIFFIDHSDVPFVVQSPDGNWGNPRWQDGCEEASVLMVLRWLEGERILNALKEMRQMSEDMENVLGTYHDTSMRDVAMYLEGAVSESGYVRLRENVTVNDLKQSLGNGSILIIATNGRLLGNPNFTAPGPEYHMLVVRGYDPATDEFITNDPGTRRGRAYRYGAQTLFSAMQDYETGFHGTRYPDRKAYIEVRK